MLILESRRDIEDLREATQPASELFIFVIDQMQLLLVLWLPEYYRRANCVALVG